MPEKTNKNQQMNKWKDLNQQQETGDLTASHLHHEKHFLSEETLGKLIFHISVKLTTDRNINIKELFLWFMIMISDWLTQTKFFPRPGGEYHSQVLETCCLYVLKSHNWPH